MDVGEARNPQGGQSPARFPLLLFFRAGVEGGIPDAPRADASIGPYKWNFTANKKGGAEALPFHVVHIPILQSSSPQPPGYHLRLAQ